MSPDNEAVFAAFINLANELASHTDFIVDDYHLIEDQAIHQAQTFLIDHLPPKFHFVVVGRGEPSLPLARYRARNELQEIGIDDLRFSPEEKEAIVDNVTIFRIAGGKIVERWYEFDMMGMMVQLDVIPPPGG